MTYKEPITLKQVITFEWFRSEYFLYILGFFLNFRPSQPFIHELFTAPHSLNFTLETVNLKIYPIYVYSTTAQLPFVFLLSDFLGYTPFIILSALSGIAASALIIWHKSFMQLQLAQAFYGTQYATEIAYFVSIYANNDPKNYQKLTSYVRVAPLLAQMISAAFGQLFISQELFSYQELYYFDLAAFAVSTLLIFTLPPIKENVYHDLVLGKEQKSFWQKISLLCSNFVKSFPDKYSIKLSIWSAFAVCGFFQVSLYIQPLWKIHYLTNNAQNGLIDIIFGFSGALAALLGGVTIFDWKYKGDLILTFMSMLLGFMLILISQIERVFYNRLFYIIYGSLSYFSLTIVTGEIVKKLGKGCFGLCIGFINLIGLIMCCVITYLLSNVFFLLENFDKEFMAYGYFYVLVGVLYIIIGMSYWLAKNTYQ